MTHSSFKSYWSVSVSSLHDTPRDIELVCACVHLHVPWPQRGNASLQMWKLTSTQLPLGAEWHSSPRNRPSQPTRTGRLTQTTPTQLSPPSRDLRHGVRLLFLSVWDEDGERVVSVVPSVLDKFSCEGTLIQSILMLCWSCYRRFRQQVSLSRLIDASAITTAGANNWATLLWIKDMMALQNRDDAGKSVGGLVLIPENLTER